MNLASRKKYFLIGIIALILGCIIISFFNLHVNAVDTIPASNVDENVSLTLRNALTGEATTYNATIKYSETTTSQSGSYAILEGKQTYVVTGVTTKYVYSTSDDWDTVQSYISNALSGTNDYEVAAEGSTYQILSSIGVSTGNSGMSQSSGGSVGGTGSATYNYTTIYTGTWVLEYTPSYTITTSVTYGTISATGTVE